MKCVPLFSRILSLFAESNDLQFAVPGGLIGVGTMIDPTLTRADRLVGQVLGSVGNLPEVRRHPPLRCVALRRLARVVCPYRPPPHSKSRRRWSPRGFLPPPRCEAYAFVAPRAQIYTELEVSYYLLRRLLGVKTAEGEKAGKVQKLAKGEILMVNIGSTSTGGRITAVRADLAKVALVAPVCTAEGEKIALSRRVDKHWRLIGWGEIRRGITIEPAKP